MPQLKDDNAKISALKVSSQGQVTLSKEARLQHGLNAGETLIEISLPGCIVLLPQSEVMADLTERAQAGLRDLGLTVEEFKTGLTKRREESVRKKYPGVFNA